MESSQSPFFVVVWYNSTVQRERGGERGLGMDVGENMEHQANLSHVNCHRQLPCPKIDGNAVSIMTIILKSATYVQGE